MVVVLIDLVNPFDIESPGRRLPHPATGGAVVAFEEAVW